MAISPLDSQLELVSIITVCFNAAETIEKTIQSVISQRYRKIEYIIIDGGSKDDTVHIIEKYSSNITYWISEEDRGIYDAMNKGISIAKGTWVYFLGADDVLYDSWVLESIFTDKKIFKSVPQVIYGNVLLAPSRKLYGGTFSRNRLIEENICHQSLFYHVGLFEMIGVFNLKYKLLSDWEFNMRVFSHSRINAVFVNRVICLYNEQGSSIMKPDINFGRDYYILLFKYFPFFAVMRYLFFKILKKVNIYKS